MTDSTVPEKGENFPFAILQLFASDLLNLIDRVDTYTDKSLKSTKLKLTSFYFLGCLYCCISFLVYAGFLEHGKMQFQVVRACKIMYQPLTTKLASDLTARGQHIILNNRHESFNPWHSQQWGSDWVKKSKQELRYKRQANFSFEPSGSSCRS